MTRKRDLSAYVFVGALFAGFFVASVVFAVAVNCVGRQCVFTEVWLPDVLKMKRYFAVRMPSPRLIVSAGSGAMFGVDCAVLSKALDMPAVNMALHASLPFEYYCEELRRMARPGDVVVLPLEIGHFYRENFEEKATSDFPLSMLFGFAPEYQRALAPDVLVRFYFRYGLTWISRNLRHEAHCAGATAEGLAVAWQKMHALPGYGGYGYHGLNEHGDMLVSRPSVMRQEERWQLSNDLSPSFLSAWRAFAADMEKAGVRVVLTWSNLLWYPDSEGFEAFRSQLAKEGIRLWGRPEAFSFPVECYFDTQYHLNAQGAALNGRELAKVVGAALGREPHFPDDAPLHVAFADSVQESFPDPKRVSVYSSGVRIPAGRTRLRVGVPRVYAGKSLSADLIVRGGLTNGAFAVSCQGERLHVQMIPHAVCQEAVLRIPRHLTRGGVVNLDLDVANPLGLERMTLLDVAPSVRLISGFSTLGTEGDRSEFEMAVPEDMRRRGLVLALSLKPNDETMVVRCGGIELARRSFDGEPCLWRVPVPASMTDADVLKFEFLFEGVRSPLERGVGPDPRRLGPGVLSMKLESGAEKTD